MLYELFELQRSFASAIAQLGASLMRGSGCDHAEALAEWLARTGRIGGLLELPVEAAVGQLVGPCLRHTVEHSTPFTRVVRLWTPASGRRRVLLLAPHSGYATAVLAQLVAALAGAAEVLVTDWHDARLVPTTAGELGIAEQRAVGLTTMRLAGPGAHLVAISQSGWAALEATVVLAAQAPELVPASATLLGSPIDASRNPVPLQRLLIEVPEPLLLQQLLVTVPATYPGRGRRVYPGLYQLAAFISGNPLLYAHVQAGLVLELLGAAASGYALQHRDLHALIDVPGGLLTDALARWRGQVPDDPAVTEGFAAWIRRPRQMPLLTIEAGSDSLVGAGQTHAAHRWLHGTDGPPLATFTAPGAEHHDLFGGPRFWRHVAPRLLRHLMHAD